MIKRILSILNKKKSISIPKSPHEPIYVIGDSHTRAFSYNPNFLPLFIGAGKEHCFINDKTYKNIKKKSYNIVKQLDNAKVMFTLGEPDTRYYLGKGWYPWDNKVEFTVKDFKPLIDKSLSRYKKLLLFLKKNTNNAYIIFNIPPSIREEQNEIVEYFNTGLESFCKQNGFLFISVNDKLYSNESIVSEKYYGDTVHLNKNVQPLVEDILIKEELLVSSKFDEEVVWDHTQVQNSYEFNEKFGCYTLKN